MSKLTKAQRETLEFCPDWSASFEVRERREEEYGSGGTWQQQQDVLKRLERLGLVEFHPANATYRITDLGRSALGEQPEVKE